MDDFNEFLKWLACASDSQLKPEYATECANFVSTGPISEIEFIISLRHKCVYFGESSHFIIHVLSYKLSQYDQELVKKTKLALSSKEI